MQTSGVILAGGKSSRMKFNKAFAEIEGKPAVQIIIDKFRACFQEIIIISNEPELFTGFHLPVYQDIYPYLGPVGGIHSALVNASYDRMFVLGCDMPFMDMGLVQYMLARLDNHDSVVPEINSFLQPLAAAYNRSCLPVFSDCLQNNKLKLVRIFSELDALVLKDDELEMFGGIREIFFNVNDPAALAEARNIAGRLL
ncbi:molybdenum cofactor guanylyltransferase [Syntrophomonas curvata]